MKIENDLTKYSLYSSVKSIVESTYKIDLANNLNPNNFLLDVNYERSYNIMYNKNGYITERCFYVKLKKLEKRYAFKYTNNFESVVRYEYDSNDCFVSTDYFDYDCKNVNYSSLCSFDHHGNVISQPYNFKGELKVMIFEYTFDERNNWIKCTRSVNGVVKVVSYRHFVYYDEEFHLSDVNSISQMNKYTIDEFKQKFGRFFKYHLVNDVINYEVIHIGSENVFIEEPLKYEMILGVQPNFDQCYIAVESRMYIPKYILKKKNK